MKVALFLTIALASTLAQAKVKKEVWSCQANGQEIVKATFTAKTISATFATEEEQVALSFANARQKSALNGSQKTVLKGDLDMGYDSYYYQITFVRTVHADFGYAGEGRGQILIETYASPSCVDPALSYEVADCTVEITE